MSSMRNQFLEIEFPTYFGSTRLPLSVPEGPLPRGPVSPPPPLDGLVKVPSTLDPSLPALTTPGRVSTLGTYGTCTSTRRPDWVRRDSRRSTQVGRSVVANGLWQCIYSETGPSSSSFFPVLINSLWRSCVLGVEVLSIPYPRQLERQQVRTYTGGDGKRKREDVEEVQDPTRSSRKRSCGFLGTFPREGKRRRTRRGRPQDVTSLPNLPRPVSDKPTEGQAPDVNTEEGKRVKEGQTVRGVLGINSKKIY